LKANFNLLLKIPLKYGLEELKKIIKECVSGDVRAQEKLYNLFAPKMFGVCLRYAKDYTEAEDNLQDGFIKVFLNIKNFRQEGSLEGWIRRIMVNVSLEKFRKQHLMFPVEDIGVYELPNYSDDILSKISANELIELIQQLPPRYRMVFNLYVMEGMNHKEISKEMNISAGTSKSNLARAREILKRKVKELYREIGTNANSTA
jgi:RNA polymerase sigma-70 factor (ECF subfamily)